MEEATPSSQSVQQQQLRPDSESGFSECSSNIPSPPEGHLAGNTLQTFLQTWTTDTMVSTQEEPPKVTLVVNGAEVACTTLKVFDAEDAELLLSVLEGAKNNHKTAVLEDPSPLPSMPIIIAEDLPLEKESPLQVCHDWVRNNPPGAEAPLTELDELLDFHQHLNSEIPEAGGTNSIDHPSRPPLSIITPNRIGVAASKGLPSDLLRDLECSSTTDTSDHEEPTAPVQINPQYKLASNEASYLDGLKLKINLKLVHKEEVKQRKRLRNSSSSSSGCRSWRSSDSLSSNSSSNAHQRSKRKKRNSVNYVEVLESSSDEEEVKLLKEKIKADYSTKWLPYREPVPTEQEEFIKNEARQFLEYNAWLEQRKLLYAKYVPEVVEKMPTNMQPRVALRRSAAIDQMALALRSNPEALYPNVSTAAENSNVAQSSNESSFSLPTLEELTGGSSGAEADLQHLLENLDDLDFGPYNSSVSADSLNGMQREVHLKSNVISGDLPNQQNSDKILGTKMPPKGDGYEPNQEMLSNPKSDEIIEQKEEETAPLVSAPMSYEITKAHPTEDKEADLLKSTNQNVVLCLNISNNVPKNCPIENREPSFVNNSRNEVLPLNCEQPDKNERVSSKSPAPLCFEAPQEVGSDDDAIHLEISDDEDEFFK